MTNRKRYTSPNLRTSLLENPLQLIQDLWLPVLILGIIIMPLLFFIMLQEGP